MLSGPTSKHRLDLIYSLSLSSFLLSLFVALSTHFLVSARERDVELVSISVPLKHPRLHHQVPRSMSCPLSLVQAPFIHGITRSVLFIPTSGGHGPVPHGHSGELLSMLSSPLKLHHLTEASGQVNLCLVLHRGRATPCSPATLSHRRHYSGRHNPPSPSLSWVLCSWS